MIERGSGKEKKNHSLTNLLLWAYWAITHICWAVGQFWSLQLASFMGTSEHL